MILNRVSSKRHLSLLKDGRVAFEVDDSQHVRPTFTMNKKTNICDICDICVSEIC